MKIELIGLDILELLFDKVEMPEPSGEIPQLDIRLSSLNDVPLILQFIKTRLISHEQLKNFLSKMRLHTFHQKLDTDIIHVSVSEIALPRFVDRLKGLQIVVHFVLDFGFHCVELGYGVCVVDCSFYVVVGFGEGLEF